MEPEKILKIRHLRLKPVIGFGYWCDVFDGTLGFKGKTHNYILPFIRIQWGYLRPVEKNVVNKSKQ